VVLPELSSIEYSRATFECLDVLAEPLDGPSFQCWQQIAMEYGCHVSYSFARKESSQFYITVAVVNPDGNLVGHYDKIHLAQFGVSMEKEYFTRGQGVFVFDVKGFRIAPIICYDIRIPELSRTLTVDHQADLILHCGAYFRDESFETWHAFVVTRAIENQIFYLSLNRAGADYGKSVLCWPWIDDDSRPVLFSEHCEEFKKITLDKGLLANVRKHYSFLSDRLPTYSDEPVSGLQQDSAKGA